MTFGGHNIVYLWSCVVTFAPERSESCAIITKVVFLSLSLEHSS